MGLLSKLAEALGYKKDDATPLVFTWGKFPDPHRAGHYIHDCQLPQGAYMLVQEVSAPDPERGHWGWILLDADSQPVEMRNGFFEEGAAKTHAEEHFRANYGV